MPEKVQFKPKFLQEWDKRRTCGWGKVLWQRYEKIFGFSKKFIEQVSEAGIIWQRNKTGQFTKIFAYWNVNVQENRRELGPWIQDEHDAGNIFWEAQYIKKIKSQKIPIIRKQKAVPSRVDHTVLYWYTRRVTRRPSQSIDIWKQEISGSEIKHAIYNQDHGDYQGKIRVWWSGVGEQELRNRTDDQRVRQSRAYR